MSLISCPECQKEISDKVKACPHCGFPFIDNIPEDLFTEDTATVDTATTEVTSSKSNLKGNKKKLIIVAICVIAVVLFVNYLNKLANVKVYAENMDTVMEEMYASAIIAEEVIDLTHKVWSNSIYEKYDPDTDAYTLTSGGWFKDDFNDALTSMMSDMTILGKVAKVAEAQENIMLKMKQLQNPPKEYEKIYDAMLDLHSKYQSLTDLAVSPSGSLSTYTESKSKKIDEFIQLYKKVKVQLPK